MNQPNFLFVFVDNLGFGELGCYGGGQLRGAPTPRIDRLASEGIRLTNMNMEAQCTPSRSAVLTGRIPVRSGTTRIPLPGWPSGLVTWERTLPEVLREQGYRSGHFGKWHLGSIDSRHPNRRGFDEWWGLLETHDSSLWDEAPGYDPSVVAPEQLFEGIGDTPSVALGPYRVEERRNFDQTCFERATDFISRSVADEKPFFAYLPLAFPHFPAIPSAEFAGVTGNGDFADSMVENDTRVGRLLDHLDDLGISDDTVVIYTSDNGAEDVLPWRGWSGPWGGSYFTAMEGCLRVPFVLRWPGRVPAGRLSNEITHAVDIFTTLISMAGADIPSDRPIDGVDLTPFLTGESDRSAREHVLCFVGDALHAVKWRNWKLHFIWQEYMQDPPVQLTIPRAFNLFDDPRERHDIFLPSNTWVQRPAQAAIREFWATVEDHPLIAPGTPDPYSPA